MTDNDWKTLRVPSEAYETAKAQKAEHGHTWGEQLVCDAPETVEVVRVDDLERDTDDGGIDIDYAELATRVADELEGRMR
jgi:hypothetical protein